MKKVFLLVALLLMSSAVWNSSEAANRAVRSLTSDAKYTYDATAPLITAATQFSTNNVSTGDSGADYFGNLIDGNTETVFHSVWETDMANANVTADSWKATLESKHSGTYTGIGYHHLQVALNDPVSAFIFKYSGRNSDWHDNPNDIMIYATNDDALAANLDVSSSSSWTFIEELKDPAVKDVVITNYISPVVKMSDSFKYIRFVIKGTTHMNTVDTRTFVKPEITGVTWNCSEFQMYQAVEVTAPLDLLKAYVDSMNDVNPTYTAGTDPGFYSQTLIDAFNAAKTKAETYLTESHTDAEYTAVEQEYRDAYKAMVPNPIKDGYYNIISDYSVFDAGSKAMYAEDNLMYWGVFDANKAKFLFHITKLEDGNYAIQNAATGGYIKNVTTNDTQTGIQVGTSETPEVDQMFKTLIDGQFLIYNPINTLGYNTDGHNSGAATSGRLTTWTSTENGEAAWTLKEVTDQDLINTLINNAPKEKLAGQLQKALAEAQAARAKTVDYTKLITNASQISSNAQSAGDGSSYANLIDGNTETIFHSVWDGTMKTVVTTGTGWHNLQFTLPYAISKMKFNYIGRNSDSWADSPDYISLYGTNDDALGASTAAADSTSWTQITDLTQGFPANGALTHYTSPIIDLGASYKYLRFVVKHTTNEGKQSDRTFVVPEITGVTFNLSEMQVYDGNPSAKSEYNTVTGMKDACDALDPLIAAAADKITNMTATQADIDAMIAATNAVNKLYVDRAALYSEFAALRDSANSVYNNAMGAKVKLITDVSQLSTNNSSAQDGSSLANLIDGNTSSVFHSHWDAAMQNASITADEWTTNQEAWVAGNTDNIAVGTGYHNLQVKLNEPVDNFYFYYYGRTGTDWHDNPNDIQIFATNDDALGASVNASESAQWKEITELTEGFPDDVAGAEYTSSTINLGAKYKYIRFVIKNTTHRDKVDSRVFNAPDITGVTWNVEEWQMYAGLSPDRIQYNYIPEVKEAVDALKTLIDADAPLTNTDILSYDPISTLRAAVNKVLENYADSTDLAALYKKYTVYADSSIVGDGIGFVKTQDAITAFRNALVTAKSSVSLTQPTKPTIDAAIASMKTAFTTFMTNVGQIVPNQWYNIITGSLRAYAQNQPIFLGSTSTGAKLLLGNYPIDQIDPKGDPYAVWRFVPIEGKDGQYAIQNMGTGQYFGAYRGQGAELSPLMDHAKTPYQLQYYGNGKFKLIQVGVADDFDCLKADQTNMMVLNYPANADSQQGWKFVAVDNTQTMSFNSMYENTIQVMTLPFALKGDLSLMNLNEGVKTYAVKYLNVTETGTTLGLKLQNDIEAGEPFIMMVGDYTQYNAASTTTHSVDFALPASVIDTSATVVNGLVGTLQGMTVNKSGLGIFVSSKLTATVKGSTSIAGRQGYINPNLVTNEAGDADLIIQVGDVLNGVKAIVATKTAEKINVYTIDGKLLKRNVKATEALKGLNKGLYIVGKKKVAVK